MHSSSSSAADSWESDSESDNVDSDVVDNDAKETVDNDAKETVDNDAKETVDKKVNNTGDNNESHHAKSDHATETGDQTDEHAKSDHAFETGDNDESDHACAPDPTEEVEASIVLPLDDFNFNNCKISDAFKYMMKNLIKDGLIDNEETFLIAKLMDKEEFDNGVPQHPDKSDIGVTAKLGDGRILKADLQHYDLVGTARNPYGYWIKKGEKKSCVAVFYSSKQQCSIKNLILNPLIGMCDEYDCKLCRTKNEDMFTPTTICKDHKCNNERVEGYRYCNICLRNDTKELKDTIILKRATSCKEWFKTEGGERSLLSILVSALKNEQSLRGELKSQKEEYGNIVTTENYDFLFELCGKTKNAVNATKEKKKSESKEKRSSLLKKRKRHSTTTAESFAKKSPTSITNM